MRKQWSSPCLFHLESQPQVCMLIDLWKTPVEMSGTSWNTPLRQWHRQLRLPVSQQTVQGEVGMTWNDHVEKRDIIPLSIHINPYHTIVSVQFMSSIFQDQLSVALCCHACAPPNIALNSDHVKNYFQNVTFFVTYGISMHFLAPKASCLSASYPTNSNTHEGSTGFSLFLCFIAGWELWK